MPPYRPGSFRAAPNTARCFGCGVPWVVRPPNALALEHILAHDCPIDHQAELEEAELTALRQAAGVVAVPFDDNF